MEGFLLFKFRFIGEVRPSLSLRGCVCSRGNLKKQKTLEINERSPQSHSLLRDDMRYTIVFQQTDKSEFEKQKAFRVEGFLFVCVYFAAALILGIFQDSIKAFSLYISTSAVRLASVR